MIMINKNDKTNTVRHLFRLGMVFLVLGAVAVYFVESNSVYTYEVYKVEDGYGYLIKKGEKVLIQQNFVPTLEGYQPFVLEQHATKAARLMIEKLKNKQVPALSDNDIKQITGA